MEVLKMAEMNEFTADLYTLIDEDGAEVKFELLDVMDHEGERYYAMTPYIEEEAENLEGDAEIIILRSDMDGEEETLVTLDDDDLYEKIGNMFLERINAEFDDEEE
ncbi:MAG: DUF1292 domain-containing protein [Ruminococcus sp.]|jgi:uncharacterized protein YrzB (UPF0473 family)|nr:DUF1292 domain-containing protein [Ruminococcus sp.]